MLAIRRGGIVDDAVDSGLGIGAVVADADALK